MNYILPHAARCGGERDMSQEIYQVVAVKMTPTHQFKLRCAGAAWIAEKQPINKATGKPWQARRVIHRGENGLKALREFNLAVKASKAEAHQ